MSMYVNSEIIVINIYENTNKKLNDMHLHW